MKKELSAPVIVAVVVVVVLLVVGVLFYSSSGPGEGKRPDPSAGGIHTSGGKVIPLPAGGGTQSHTSSAQ